MCKNIIKLFIEEVEDKMTYNSYMDSYYAEANETYKTKINDMLIQMSSYIVKPVVCDEIVEAVEVQSEVDDVSDEIVRSSTRVSFDIQQLMNSVKWSGAGERIIDACSSKVFEKENKQINDLLRTIENALAKPIVKPVHPCADMIRQMKLDMDIPSPHFTSFAELLILNGVLDDCSRSVHHVTFYERIADERDVPEFFTVDYEGVDIDYEIPEGFTYTQNEEFVEKIRKQYDG